MNRLSSEKSPYLLKHADNPVDWYPWCQEAFQKAKAEDKPVFLSIGYSSCHWCNVMEEESFRDAEVARLLNGNFVCIKVDREERPDIDNLYLAFCQMMTGSGGWPLTIIMTPDKKPFFAATYIPRESKFGMVGLIELIPRVEELWKDRKKRGDLISQGERLIHSLKSYLSSKTEGTVQQADAEACFEQMLALFDEKNGGFGTAPKFPTPHRLIFLIRYYRLKGDNSALIMAEKTLTAMRNGGIFDQIGYGIHRYSTDAYWMVPHFEKMLYDQALSIMAYTEAYEATGKKFYLNTAEEIAEYVLSELRDKEGGFLTSESADSEGKEGKFYVWGEEELKKLLDKEEYELAHRAYLGKMKINVDGGGYLLHMAQSVGSLAEEYRIGKSDMQKKLENIRKKLLNKRNTRVRPDKDDKILADWNGLTIAAFSKLYSVTCNERYIEAAKKAANFILSKMKSQDGRLLHRYRDGESSIDGFLEDYAFMCWGLVELYEACFENKYLEEAIKMKDYALQNFWDGEKGGFFQAEDKSELSYRMKEAQDGALPSGNSVMAYSLFLLSRLTGKTDDTKYIEKMKEVFSSAVKSSPAQYSFFLIATCLLPVNFREIVIVCKDKSTSQAAELLQEVKRHYIPNKVVLLRRVNDEGKGDIDGIADYVRNYATVDSSIGAYVCTDFACQLPVSTKQELAKVLQ